MLTNPKEVTSNQGRKRAGLIAALSLLVALAGCSATRTNTNQDKAWRIVSVPPMPDYPEGNLYAPRSLWMPVDGATYASYEGCAAKLKKAFNSIQRPLDCIANDDPRLKGN